MSPQRSLSHSFAIVLDAPFVEQPDGERGRLSTLLRKGGLLDPEGASGTPLCPVDAGTGIMEPLNRRRRTRGGVAGRKDSLSLGGRGTHQIITGIIITGFITKHRHWCSLPGLLFKNWRGLWG